MTTIILTGVICFLIGILITCAIKDTPTDYPSPCPPAHYPFIKPSLYCSHCDIHYPHKYYTDMEIKVMQESTYHKGRYETLEGKLYKFEDKINSVQNILDEIKFKVNLTLPNN